VAGSAVQTLVSQYVAFIDGRLHEVAYDFYRFRTTRSGVVLRRDVFNFKDGAITDTHGTWIAGATGRPR
jgi:hypothetical protein